LQFASRGYELLGGNRNTIRKLDFDPAEPKRRAARH
jgi:hypothetical protein